MQKLLASLLNTFYTFLFRRLKIHKKSIDFIRIVYRYLFQQFNSTLALTIYIRSLGLIFIFALGAILFQYNDLLLVDTVPVATSLEAYSSVFNIFRLISPIYFKYFLWGSIISSLLMIFGVIPFWALLYNVFIYSSLLLLFPTFLSFQWDILLIEVAIFSLFLVSPKYLFLDPRRRYFLCWVQIIPIILLMVRLFYHSAVVKVLSNDTLWLSLTALDIHLYSQPLPHFLSYHLHSFIIKNNFSVPFLWVMFLVEFLLPFALLIPTYRKIAASVLIIFQTAIIFSGNYGFFNFLTIVVLFVPLLISEEDFKATFSKSFSFVAAPILFIILINSLFMIPKPLHSLPVFTTLFKQLRICNNYGLFARMTRNQTRYRLFISKTSATWIPVKLHYFDHHGYPTMSFIHPYHPRIRWQLWFKFLSLRRYPNWYLNFIKQIAKDPSRLPSIVQPGVYPKNNLFVKMCYDDIVFDLDANDSDYSQFWNTLGRTSCHIYSLKSNKITIINP